MTLKRRQPKCGIYQIRNETNGKVYIGSAVDIEDRWRLHRLALSNGTHHSRYLQRAWGKYGETNFSFVIVELVLLREILIEREQFHIDHFKSADREFGYNMSPTAGSILGMKHTDEARANMSKAHVGKKASPEWVAKMREIMKGRKPSPQTIAAMISYHKGRPKTAEERKKMSDARKAYYTNNPDARAKTGGYSKGRKASQETRAKMSVASKGNARALGFRHTDEAKERIGSAQRGAIRSAETRAKLSAAKSRQWADPNSVYAAHRANPISHDALTT